MRLSNVLAFLPLAAAKVLVKYSAADGDDPSSIGFLNLEGWNLQSWPSGQGMNSSLYFEKGQDPDGVPAAHVHRDGEFRRAEYHALKGKTTQNSVYYVGYHVRFDKVDYQTIVFQWKNYDGQTVGSDDIPAALVFRSDPDGNNNHTINWGVSPDPSSGVSTVPFKKTLEMGKAYRFGVVIDTSESDGYAQLYFEGESVAKTAGNFWPGPTKSSDPKFGLYGGKTYEPVDSYIYDVVIGTTLEDITAVAGIGGAKSTGETTTSAAAAQGTASKASSPCAA